MGLAEQLKMGLGSLGVACSDEQIEQVLRYQQLLLKWNRVTNLTSITDPVKVASHHLLDAFSIQPFVTGKRVVDIGSGAGLPGIPLALINPGKDFILLDANGKKTRFITQAKIELGLSNVEVVQTRAEDYQGQFDHVVSRAFRNLAEFVEVCEPLVCPGGNLLAMKGPDYEQEIKALDTADYLTVAHRLQVPGVDGERYLVEIRKPEMTRVKTNQIEK